MKDIALIDHVTYAVPYERAETFIEEWRGLGYEVFTILETRIYPAKHIALSGPGRMMIGLSISEDPTSPINEFVRRYGEGVQHVAYSVDYRANMHELVGRLLTRGWVLLPPTNSKNALGFNITYVAPDGAGLNQIFTAPKMPYGFFTEFVQRVPGKDGAAYPGFDVENIEQLYERYQAYSRRTDWMSRPRKERGE